MNTYLPEGMRIGTTENTEYIRSKEGLCRALERGAILEAPAVLCDHHLNLHVSLGGGMMGRIPKEEVQYLPDSGTVKDIAILTRVGKPVCFHVTGFAEGERGESIALLSRRSAQRECALCYLSDLRPGDIIGAKVTHLENFGAFLDIGCGMICLLSIDCISVSRICHPSVRLQVGQHVYTVVKSIDERGRIYASQRELFGSWEENAALFHEGQTVKGTVRSVESYGIFIELTPNLAGLAEYREGIRENDTAAVYIKSMIPDKMKIKLIIIDAHPAEHAPAPLRYFIDPSTVRHMESWQYSPAGCKRLIESVF